MTWTINLRQLLRIRQPVHIDAQLELQNAVQSKQEIVNAEPLQVHLQAEANQRIVRVEGTSSTKLELECSRCLSHYESALQIPFHERFQLAEEEALPESEDIQVVSEDCVDLRPYIEEAFWLSLPFVHLCEEDCKGLCQTCGTNLNERECGCKQDNIDPRLAALQDFFKNE